MMQAVLLKENGGPEQLYVGDTAKPVIKNHEVLVKVKAAAINRADILQRKGFYPPPAGASDILGLEASGDIVEVGANVEGWQLNDKVFALLPGGGYAEYVAIPQSMLMSVPENLSYVEAAGIAEVFFTAYQSLCYLAQLQSHETVLIHAGASGVGSAAIQLAKQIKAQIITTASQEEKLAFAHQLGADTGINYKEQSFVEAVNVITEGRGVDVVIDFIGADYFADNLKTLSDDGRLVMLAFLGGRKVPEADLTPIIAKRLQIMGSTLRSRGLAYQTELTRAFSKNYLPLFGTGELRPVIDKELPWGQVAVAHRYLEANESMGKVVLTGM